MAIPLLTTKLYIPHVRSELVERPRLIKRLNDSLGITSIVVSHDVEETSSIADESYLISEGQVVASGTPSELKTHGNAVVQQFLSGMADGPVPFHYPGRDYKDQLLDRD